jgi:hypothetical protein
MIKSAEKTEVVASAMASIDGNEQKFWQGKTAKSIKDEPGGRYSGYMADADELIRRIAHRGLELNKIDI